jgi:hypothetical protein
MYRKPHRTALLSHNLPNITYSTYSSKYGMHVFAEWHESVSSVDTVAELSDSVTQ